MEKKNKKTETEEFEEGYGTPEPEWEHFIQCRNGVLLIKKGSELYSVEKSPSDGKITLQEVPIIPLNTENSPNSNSK